MYWADKIAQDLKKRKLLLEWVDDMKTPSGKVHVGALRGVVIHDLVFKALKDIKVTTKYTYIFDNHDPMDGLPVYLPKEKYEKYLGIPLYKVPSPVEGYANYADYYAKDFTDAFNKIGCFPEIIWATDLYLSGKMNSIIKECLDKAEIIRGIYEELYKKKIPKDWYPFEVYCPKCGKVSTTKVYDWDGQKVKFRCSIEGLDWTKGCGYEGEISPFSNENGMVGKLRWKVEWGSKWKALGITVEGAGKDHMSKGGSHDLTSLICKKVLNYPVPFPVPYEFFLIGGKKMSSSKGRGSSASEMLEILPPTLLRFLMVKTKINQAIDFDPSGDIIPKLFDEYQMAALEYIEKKKTDLARIFELSHVGQLKIPPKVRFQVLTQWIQMPNMEEEIKKEGLKEWVPYAKTWVEKFAPDSMRFSIQKKLPDEASNLSEKQREYLRKLVLELEKWKEEESAEEFQKKLYELSKEIEIPSKDAFSAIYMVLIGKSFGPKAAWLILKENRDFIKKRFEEAVSLKDKVQNFTNVKKMNRPEIFSIDKNLKEKFPSISVGIAVIKGVKIKKSDPGLEKEKKKLLDSFQNLTTEKIGEFEEVKSYRRLYKETGIDWHSKRPSPEALLRRIALRKGLYTVNTCVDAYNFVVMKNRVSVGAFDYDKIKFPTVLRFANKGEKILLLGDTELTEYKEEEIAYFDRDGGFNIDFNYRDAQRTAIQLDTKNIYVNVDGIFDITPEMVEKVLKEACDKIIKYCGGKIEFFGVDY